MKNKIYLAKNGNIFRVCTPSGKTNRMNKFLEAIEVRGLSKQTIRAYGYDLVFLCRWLQKSKVNWKNFTQKDLLKYINFQRLMNSKPKSINRRLTTCELFYKFCFNKVVKEAVGVNKASPFYKGRGLDRHLGIFKMGKSSNVKLKVKVPNPLVEILTPKDIEVFLEGMHRYRDLAIVYLMLLCGFRFSEILSIKIPNIDWDQSLIKVTGKGNKERVMPIPDMLKTIIKKYLTLERPKESNGTLFVILQGLNKGSPMTNSGLRSLFRYRRKTSGLTKANPHKFRHTFGSRMAAENVGLPILQKMMGHADISTTLQYIHLSSQDVTKEFQKAMVEIQKDYV